MHYPIWYGKVSTFFTRHPFYLRLLRLYNRCFSILVALMYGVFLFLTRTGPTGVYLWLPASGFFLLSFVRKQLDYPRPYEVWNITPLLMREGQGEAMPSRHVFSATIISMVILQGSTMLGSILLVLSLGLAVVRVLGGVHYPKDVMVGYLMALIWGSIFYLF